jgi:hypothetical protein
MSQTIQKKIRMYYALWLFLIFVLMAAYILITGRIFMEYATAKPWINGYIIIALIGNIGALIGTYYYLSMKLSNSKMLIVYEVLFVVILALTYLVIAREWLPSSLGSLNFETLLNAVLPLAFIFIMLIEYFFSKSIRQMPVKAR